MRTLQAYFGDATSETLCAGSPWEDGEAVEEALTAATAYRRRHKPLPTPAKCGWGWGWAVGGGV